MKTDELTCPHCMVTGKLTKYGTKRGKQNYKCKACKKQAGTPIEYNGGMPQTEHELSGHANTLEEFIESLDIDFDVWEIVSVKAGNSSWDVSSKKRDQKLKWTKEDGKDGYPVQLMVGHSNRGDWEKVKNTAAKFSVTIRPRKDAFNADKFRRELIESTKLVAPYVPKKDTHHDGDCALEVSIFDLHLGKMAWAPESGNNYNHRIGQERFFASIEYFISLAKIFKISEVIFTFGSDFFNTDYDYPFPQTTHGTPQDNDLRWQKLFKIGREMIIQAVNRLSEVAPVRLIGIPGNHDFQKTFYLGDVLDVRYENDENVTVDNSPKTRKYYLYGKNLLGLTHGNDVPESRLLMLMPQEEPQLWAKSKYREWHCGHLHHGKKVSTASMEDVQGITIRYLKTLKGTDEWEAKKGYVGSIGGAEAFVWHKENGLIANFNYNL